MYVEGNILLEPEKAMALTGADTAEHAAAVLASNGVPVTKAYIRRKNRISKNRACMGENPWYLTATTGEREMQMERAYG